MFKKINIKNPDILGALAHAPLHKKQGQVHARPAMPDEKIVTTLASGLEETTNTARVGDWIITNPAGEKYIVPKQKFSDRYESTNANGIFHAKDYIRAMKNPYNEPIEIVAPWDAPMMGDENCMIADACDANGNNMQGKPYLIEGKAFAETYAKEM